MPMAIHSYLVLTASGAAPAVARAIAALSGCDVVPARDADLLLLVTESSSADEDATLRERLETTPGVAALLLTFGDLDPDAPSASVRGA